MATKRKIWLLTAAALILIGGLMFVGVMSALKWDFTKLSTVRYVTKDYEITEEFTNISIDSNTAKIQILPSEDQTVRVTCLEEEFEPFDVSVKEGALKIEVQNNKKWYHHIGISFGCPKLTVYLPEETYGQVTIKNTTGAVSLEHIAAENMTITVSTGYVTATDVSCSETMRIKATTGKTTLENVQCGNLWSDGITGDITMKQVEATVELCVERTTGNVTLNHCDAREINIATSTGNVTGSLLSPKNYEISTTTGKVSVPNSHDDTGITCNLKTTTGNITITEE